MECRSKERRTAASRCIADHRASNCLLMVTLRAASSSVASDTCLKGRYTVMTDRFDTVVEAVGGGAAGGGAWARQRAASSQRRRARAVLTH
eukprot:3403596-Rhodomonas_salina.1